VAAGVTGKFACTDAVCKDLKELDFVGNMGEEGILVEAPAEPHPYIPLAPGSGTAARNDAGSGRFLCKAEVTAELIFDLRGQRTQELRCG
jgi:hypothetical protein